MNQDADHSELSVLRHVGYKEEELESVKTYLKEKEKMYLREEEMTMEMEEELSWSNSAQTIGNSTNSSGNDETKKCHYVTFTFRGSKYELEDAVILLSEDPYNKPYVAIIKDIYKQGEEGDMKLKVQWFYRPEDVEKKYLKKWESKYEKELFYSFHCDEVFAESVKEQVSVYFVPENKQIPEELQGSYIVQKVYDVYKKKLKELTDEAFDEEQEYDIDFHVTKTISILGDLPNVTHIEDFDEEEQHDIDFRVGDRPNATNIQETRILSRRRSAPKRLTSNAK